VWRANACTGKPTTAAKNIKMSEVKRAGPRIEIDDTGNETIPPAAEFVEMLKAPGIPPLESCNDLKALASASPRAWIQAFKGSNGKELVHAKLKELEELKKARQKGFFSRW
jgi:hypothetical protein